MWQKLIPLFKAELENCAHLKKKMKHQKYHLETLDPLFPNTINISMLY